MFKISGIALAACTTLLAACGGGGDAAPVARAEGVCEGTTNTGRAFQALILDDDQFWAIYGTMSGGAFLVSGFVQGQGSSNDGAFSSGNAKDFGFVPPIAGALNATYAPGASFSGTLTATSGSVTFNGTAIPPSRFDYAMPAAIASVSGAWNMTTLTGAPAVITISGTGTLSGSSNGCAFSGTIVPRLSGKNVFNVRVTFGSLPCALPNQAGAGIAVTYLINGGPGRQLIIAGVDGARNNGIALLGSR